MLTNSNFYIGDSSISRLYQGDNLVWDSSHPDILLEYIANGPDTDNSKKSVFFNTGVVPDVSTKVEICCAAAIIDKGVNVPIISAADADWKGLVICTPMNTGTITSRLGGSYIDGPSIVSNTKYIVTTYQSTSTQGDMIVNGTAYSHSTTNVYGLVPAYLFAYNVNGTVNTTASWSGMKIYYLKFWEDNNLIRFYIPVLHYTNGQYTPCFYDKVNDTYIYNLGTDTPTYKIQGDYLLDWLGSEPETSIPDSSAFYLRYDTGVVASNQLQVDTKSRVVYGRDQYIFGSGTSAQTTPPWQPYGYGTPGGTGESTLLRLRVGFGATSTTNYTTYLAAGDSSTVNAVNTLSMWCNSERGLMCLNGTMYNTQSPVPDTFPSPTIHLLARHGSSTVTQISRGARIYYINFTTANIPTRTIIPVLHNSKPEFLDLQAGTYLPIHGNTSPYGVLKN